MNEFALKLISAIIIVSSIIFYNNIIQIRAQSETISSLEYMLKNQTGTSQETNKQQNIYKNGEYQGEAQGFGGTIKVKVSVKEGAVSSVEILSAEKEDKTYLSMAKAIIDDILKKQDCDVDTVSGATFSSTGIKNAVKQALGKAE